MTSDTGDNSPVESRDTPCELDLQYLETEEMNIQKYSSEYRIHHFYVRCKELRETPLPLDANPRRPADTTQVQAMRRTFKNAPAEFVNRNNGIVMLASDVDTSDLNSEVHFDFDRGEGICNGGHTMLAIQRYSQEDTEDESMAHLEVIELGDEDMTEDERQRQIASIADARNNNNQLEERSEANFLGYYDVFKEQLLENRVINWFEGDRNVVSDALNAYHFFRLLISLDVERYGHPLYGSRQKNHSGLATSISRVHSSWKKDMDDWMLSNDEELRRPLEYLVPLTNDIVYLRELVSHNLKWDDYPKGTRRHNLFQKYIISEESRELWLGRFSHKDGYDLPSPFEVMMTGLFRTNLYMSTGDVENTELVGWFRSPESLWAKRGHEVVVNLQQDFKDAGDDPKNFIRLNGPFTHDLYIHGMNEEVSESPDVVYSVSEKTRYRRVENREHATHELQWAKDPTKPDELVEIEDSVGTGSWMREEQLTDVFDFIT
ncbi:AIPR family protein [Haloarculaceae archaeon H-GB11]|nr:AIPR family protein [Haloarculaceae archaeon H-GB11]